MITYCFLSNDISFKLILLTWLGLELFTFLIIYKTQKFDKIIFGKKITFQILSFQYNYYKLLGLPLVVGPVSA